MPPLLIVVLVRRHEDLRRCYSGDARVTRVSDSFEGIVQPCIVLMSTIKRGALWASNEVAEGVLNAPVCRYIVEFVLEVAIGVARLGVLEF